MTKKATVQAPLCEDHKNHWFKRLIISWVSFGVVALICGPLLLSLMLLPRDLNDTLTPFVCTACGILGVGWLITIIVCQSTAIRPKEITEYEITLEGVSQEFADEMKDFERRRRVGSKKRRPADDEDDEDEVEVEPEPSKKKPSSNSIKESRPAKKLRPAEDEEEAEEERPRKKQAASDAIKESRPAKKLRPAEDVDEDERPRKKRRPSDDEE